MRCYPSTIPSKWSSTLSTLRASTSRRGSGCSSTSWSIHSEFPGGWLDPRMPQLERDYASRCRYCRFPTDSPLGGFSVPESDLHTCPSASVLRRTVRIWTHIHDHKDPADSRHRSGRAKPEIADVEACKNALGSRSHLVRGCSLGRLAPGSSRRRGLRRASRNSRPAARRRWCFRRRDPGRPRRPGQHQDSAGRAGTR